jgi:hypothetical protein
MGTKPQTRPGLIDRTDFHIYQPVPKTGPISFAMAYTEIQPYPKKIPTISDQDFSFLTPAY